MNFRSLVVLIYSVILQVITLISFFSIDYGEKYGIIGESIFYIYITTAWIIAGLYILLIILRFIKTKQLIVRKDILYMLKISIVYLGILSLMVMIYGVGLESLWIILCGGLLLIPVYSICFYRTNFEISIENLLVGLYSLPVTMYNSWLILIVMVDNLF